MAPIVSVSRILNEDDIVEAFVRHNACHLDHMLFLDNGSSDRTLEILKSLQAEGFSVSVFQTRSVSFNEVAANSWAYQLASQIRQAGWVAHLDADEFIVAPAGTKLGDYLAGVEGEALSLPLLHYAETRRDNPEEPVVPRRMRRRRLAAPEIPKLVLRGGLGPEISIDAGNHGARRAGAEIPAAKIPVLALAHYSRRDGYQNLQKIAAGWLKSLAAGEQSVLGGNSFHYRSPFETLRDKPWELIANPAYLDEECDISLTVEAPIAYRGGALRYWQPSDPAHKAVTMFLRYTEQLARQHGRLLDESPQARALVEAWNAKREFLF